MDDYTDSTYGDRIAETYDEHVERIGRGDPSSAVAFLAELAGPEPLLELGIGTGRIALPLKDAGVEVHGIDSSEAMVARLRSKPGGPEIPVTMGPFHDFELDTRFRVIAVPFNTFFGLLSQEDQISCFRAVSRHLAPAGVFVVEAFVPDLTRFTRDQSVTTTFEDVETVLLDVSRHDPVAQRVSSHHVILQDGSVRLFPVRIRYAWPSELDLMARLAGLRLRERWESWDRAPFTSASEGHISVWEREA